MGLLLTYSNYKVAAFLAAIGSLVAGLYVLAFIQPKSPLKERQKGLYFAKFANILQICHNLDEGLVLGCFEADFCE